MYREAETVSISVVDYIANCVSVGEKMGFGKDALRQAFAEVLGQNFKSASAGSGDILADWLKFYKDVLEIDVDLSGVQIPPDPGGFGRVIIVAQDITLNQVFEACLNNFSAWKYIDDLDDNVTHNDRTSVTSYARRFRNRVEADEELKNLSANDLDDRGIGGITLLERLLYELKYWKETGKHLDIHNWTLCSGSRDSGGNVPDVDWLGDKLRVHWAHPDHSYDYLRSRAAV